MIACVLTLISANPSLLKATDPPPESLPGIGQSLVLNETKAVLLSVERLGERDRETVHGLAPGGLRIIWLVENRPGAPLAPVFGEVRVLFGQRLYNPVTNATSRRPFAPDMIIHDRVRFLRVLGQQLQPLAPPPRAGAISVIVEVYVRGDLIPSGIRGLAEIALGDSTATDLTRVRFDRFQFKFAIP